MTRSKFIPFSLFISRNGRELQGAVMWLSSQFSSVPYHVFADITMAGERTFGAFTRLETFVLDQSRHLKDSPEMKVSSLGIGVPQRTKKDRNAPQLLGKFETSHPPPRALIKRTLASSRRLWISMSFRSLASSIVCAVITWRYVSTPPL